MGPTPYEPSQGVDLGSIQYGTIDARAFASPDPYLTLAFNAPDDPVLCDAYNQTIVPRYLGADGQTKASVYSEVLLAEVHAARDKDAKIERLLAEVPTKLPTLTAPAPLSIEERGKLSRLSLNSIEALYLTDFLQFRPAEARNATLDRLLQLNDIWRAGWPRVSKSLQGPSEQADTRPQPATPLDLAVIKHVIALEVQGTTDLSDVLPELGWTWTSWAAGATWMAPAQAGPRPAAPEP